MSPLSLIEKARKKLFRQSIKDDDRSVLTEESNDHFDLVPTSNDSSNTYLPRSVLTTQRPWPTIFHQNVPVAMPPTVLPLPGARFETISQLAHCNILLLKYLSPSLAAGSIDGPLNPSQQAFLDRISQDEGEQNRILWLTRKVLEEFKRDDLKTFAVISEILVLGPTLDQEYYRLVLHCLIHVFENACLMDVDLLQGLIQLVQCASPDYLLADDLVRILAVLRNRLQDTHQQRAEHCYYLVLALSSLLDAMVEGKIQDLNRVVDHEPLSRLLGELSKSSDPYLKHQATYALQGLLHIPNDELRRQFVLRNAGNITMGLLGVASICKLGFAGLSEGATQLYDAAVGAPEVVSKVVERAQSVMESGQGLWAAVKGGILHGGRLLWYTALREAQEHIRNGRLVEFNRVVLEAPCRREVEFQRGICLLLGEIVVESDWNVITRQHAVDFLAELYKSDFLENPSEGVDQWILTILRQVYELSDSTISDHAQSALQGLEKGGTATKQTLYRDVMAVYPDPYPLRIRLPVPPSSLLLDRVQTIPDIEDDLQRLRQKQLGEYQTSVYIPPQAKPTLQSPDDTLFPLMEKVQEFLSSHRHVLLLLGDSGAGKSIFNRELEYNLWNDYRDYGSIPLFIHLPTIDQPEQDLIGKRLRQLDFTENQILEMKMHRQFIVICDGYDESQLRTNLHTSNQWNQPGKWRAKVVVSCRSQYLGSDYRARFQPQPASRYDSTAADLFEEAVIASFSQSQIHRYIEEYVKRLPAHDSFHDRPSWTKEEYMDRLLKIPNIMELVSNPFLLTLTLEALPEVVGAREKSSMSRITRAQLYDIFVQRWLKVNQTRHEGSSLSESKRTNLILLMDDDFVCHGIRYQKDLATAIFKEQAGNPVVQYTHLRDRDTWKASFFSPDSQVKLLLESSTVTRSGNYFRFLHRSLLEYFYSRYFYDPWDFGFDKTSDDQPTTANLQTSLAERSLIDEPSVLLFLAERVEQSPFFQQQLFEVVEQSRTGNQAGQAAANAISILVKAGVRFNGMDLRGISIPGADVRGGEFDSVNFEGADLNGVDFTRAWIRQADFNKAQMDGVIFGEFPYLDVALEATCCAYSPGGQFLAIGLSDGLVDIYDTRTWTVSRTLRGHTKGLTCLAYSPDGQRLVSASRDRTISMWDITSGSERVFVTDCQSYVVESVAFSPDGHHFLTGGSDSMVQEWDALNGSPYLTPRVHANGVKSVAYSPDGLFIVSGGNDGQLRIWQADSDQPPIICGGHSDGISSVAFSPIALEVASASLDGTVRLWNMLTGSEIAVLRDHTQGVSSVSFSSDGGYLATASLDKTARIWDVLTRVPLRVLRGSSGPLLCLSFAPDGYQIAAGCSGRTVRLWGALRDPSAVLNDKPQWNVESTSRTGHVYGVAGAQFSPSGRHVATSSNDGTIIQWDTQSGEPSVLFQDQRTPLTSVAYSPSGDRLASGTWNYTILHWDLTAGGSPQTLTGHNECITALSFSPCGLHLASGSADWTVRLWNLSTNTLIRVLHGHKQDVRSVAFSPDGSRIVSSSGDKTVRIWRAETGYQEHVLPGHKDCVTSVTYSLDGKFITSASDDGTVRIWKAESAEQVTVVEAHDGGVLCASFSPNGHWIATGGFDNKLRLWNAELRYALAEEGDFFGAVTSVSWMASSDGNYLVTGSADNSVRIWKIMDVGGKIRAQLGWSSKWDVLVASGANIHGAIGLSASTTRLLLQRDATDKSVLSGSDEEERKE